MAEEGSAERQHEKAKATILSQYYALGYYGFQGIVRDLRPRWRSIYVGYEGSVEVGLPGQLATYTLSAEELERLAFDIHDEVNPMP